MSEAAVPDRLFLDFQAAVAGRYSLERELGRGGMGIVYLAREVRLDRPVAIKLLPPAGAADGRLRERFLREARTAAKLSHPNIIPIHAVDDVGEFVFFAMAYVEGETLTERVRLRGPLPPAEAARILREVAWALAYAHSQGVIHRDVKPDNILLEAATGRALVADFGIAGLVTGAAALDGGEVVGTPEFMSPEQALGERVDARSDLYSVGAVGFFAVTGRVPFAAGKATEVLAKQVTEPAPPLATVAPGVPRKLARAIDRCLAKTPAERFQQGEELAEQVSLALELRREIPVALRVFVKRNARITAGGALVYLWVLAWVAGLVAWAVPESLGPLAGWGSFLAGLTLPPLAVLVRRARRLLKSGFGPDELDTAFRAEIEQAREERAFEFGRKPSRYEWIMRWSSVAGLGTAALSSLLLALNPALADSWLPLTLGVSLTIGVGTGLLALVRLGARRDLDTRFWAWFWRSRLGAWLFRLARAGGPMPAALSVATGRPTELALSMAAEKLFDDLPRDTRRALRDLPDVVHRLEADAHRMRRRLEELQDALADAESGERDGGGQPRSAGADLAARRDRIRADLTAERDVVQRRLQDAVAALETIRLNLLKLHAGAATVQSITTDLGLAQDVAKEIDLLLESRREAEELG